MGAGLAPGSQRLRTSSLGAGWGRTLQAVCVQARRGRLGPKKVTKAGIVGNSWCHGPPDSPRPYASLNPGRRRCSLGRAAGPEGSTLGGLSGTLTRKSQARGRLSLGPPPTPQGPLFSIKFKLELLGTLPRAVSSPPSPPPFCTTSPLTLPLSLSHHLVCTAPAPLLSAPPPAPLSRLRSPVRPKHSGDPERPPPACSRLPLRAPAPLRGSLCSSRPHGAGSLRRAGYSCKVTA